MIIGLVLSVFLLQSPQGFRNLNFEEGRAGAEPPGWSVSDGFRVRVESAGAKRGRFCGSIERSNRNLSFGAMSQVVDAKPFLGKRMTLRSFVKTEPTIPSNRASLFLGVYRADGSRAAYNNNDSYIIKTETWMEFEITIDVPLDGAQLHFGILLTGDGKAFWDDIRAEVIEVSDQANELPRRLEGRALENIVAFARLLGYVRYFYPGEDIDKVDWDKFAMDGIRIVESASDSSMLAELLQDWISPIAPAIRVFPTEKSEENQSSFRLPREGAIAKVYWRHQGPPGGKSNADCIRSERIHSYLKQEIPSSIETPEPEHPFYSDIGGGVSCLVPVALYEDALGVLPRQVSPPQWKKVLPRLPGFIPSVKDRATRLAGIALAWNVFQHFYPYFEEVKADWLNVLPVALTRAAVDPDETAFLATLRYMLVPLQDGHARALWLKNTNFFIPPIGWDWIEEQLVITRVDESRVEGISTGDVVQTIGGMASAKVLALAEQEISSPSPQWKRWRALRQVLEGPLDSQIALEIRSGDGSTSTKRLIRTILCGSTPWERLQEFRSEKIEEMKPGVFYVNIGKISTDEFNDRLPTLQQAKGIIFDLRGYPWAINEIFLQHLIRKPAKVPGAYMPVVYFPDQRALTFTEDLNEPLLPKEPHLDARLIFLANNGSISMAESYLTVVEANELGKIVGSTTAATNGVTSAFVIPGDIQIVWTAMKMTKPFGARFHGIGISPTQALKRSVAGAAGLRDETLDYAIQTLTR